MIGPVIEHSPGRHRPEARPTVLSSQWLRGFRISRVRRPDGSSFTVTVPSWGMADGAEHLAPRHRWIRDDGGRREPSSASVLRLAAAISGAGGYDEPTG